MDPTNENIWNRKGIVVNDLKKYEAIKCYDKAIEIEIDANYVYALGNKL
jgi:hypothetical protein